MIWVNDMLDDEPGGMRYAREFVFTLSFALTAHHIAFRNCFVVMAPEKSFILQADSHRAKVRDTCFRIYTYLVCILYVRPRVLHVCAGVQVPACINVVRLWVEIDVKGAWF